MRVLISHHDAVKLLCAGETVYNQLLRGFRLEKNDDGDGACAEDALVFLASNPVIFAEMEPLPALPNGYRWAGDDPRTPTRIERVNGAVIQTHCVVAKTKDQRDICEALALLYDRNQHE